MQYLPDIELGAMVNPNESPESNKKAIASPKQPKSPGAPAPGMKALATGFVPGEFDVICKRGKAAKDHPGNKWFRSLIQEHIQEYSECETKLDKSFVVSKVLKRVRKASPQGGFVKEFQGGTYWEVGDRLSREKIGQTFRDMLHNQYKSSTKAKASRRKQKTSEDDQAKPPAKEEKSPGAESSPTKGNDKDKDKASAGPSKRSSTKMAGAGDNIPRKKAKSTGASSGTSTITDATSAMPTLPSMAMFRGSSLSSTVNDPASRLSLSNSAVNPIGMAGFDAAPPLPNLNRCMGAPLPQGQAAAAAVASAAAASAASANALLLNQTVIQNEMQLQLQQQQLRQQQQRLQQQQQQFLRQRQFAATRTTDTLGNNTPGGELESSVPLMESITMHSAALPSASFGASFGEEIDEMYQGQLFASDHTLESNSSGSLPKLPASSSSQEKKSSKDEDES
ncbi:Nitrilase family, member 2 [Seminavis robusta]|uniref:Nitrilase family, member 2 n=1 Tax=Seminavis robusta TaxID=568900 RepID=A0A9N8DHT4_9STRA|nr:Nitrilase family, member 2 [Seminavis robusta]|eukprot:Sro97_g050080.1 Nitrilase family, member 2 (451) ;mRNA; f:87123-88712